MQKLQKSTTAVRWLIKKCNQSLWGVLGITLAQSLGSLCTVGSALIFKYLMDVATQGQRGQFLKGILLFAGVMLFQILLRTWSRFMTERTRATVENQLKQQAYQKMLEGDYETLSNWHTGELMNRLTSDTRIVADQVTDMIPSVVAMVVKLLAAIGILIQLQASLAAVFFIGGVILVAVSASFRKVIKRYHKQMQEADGVLRSFLQETLGSVLVIRSFGANERAVNMAETHMAAHKKKRMEKNRFSNLCNLGFALVMNGGYFLGLVWCGVGILENRMTYGTLAAVLQLVTQIQQPFANMSGYVPRYYAMIASTERLMELESMKPDAVEQTQERQDKQKNQDTQKNLDKLENQDTQNFSAIIGRKLSFRYAGQLEPVLNQADIIIKRKETVAIVGHSGIGKSTFLKLLLAVYPAQNLEEAPEIPGASEASSTIESPDELEASDTPETSVLYFQMEDGSKLPVSPETREYFSYVPQGNLLLSGSIANAIDFLRPQSQPFSKQEQEQIQQAAKIACADEFIRELPEGYQSVLGEKGAGLSEGQLQRISIARAIYHDAPILLLDEATSALDEDTETRVLRNIQTLTDKTVIIVTHRKAALACCDRVYQVEHKKFILSKE